MKAKRAAKVVKPSTAPPPKPKAKEPSYVLGAFQWGSGVTSGGVLSLWMVPRRQKWWDGSGKEEWEAHEGVPLTQVAADAHKWRSRQAAHKWKNGARYSTNRATLDKLEVVNLADYGWTGTAAKADKREPLPSDPGAFAAEVNALARDMASGGRGASNLRDKVHIAALWDEFARSYQVGDMSLDGFKAKLEKAIPFLHLVTQDLITDATRAEFMRDEMRVGVTQSPYHWISVLTPAQETARLRKAKGGGR